MTPVAPVTNGLTLQGTYKYISYSGLVGINAFSTSSTEYLSFASDALSRALTLASSNFREQENQKRSRFNTASHSS
jgi:hypothetical protein